MSNELGRDLGEPEPEFECLGAAGFEAAHAVAAAVVAASIRKTGDTQAVFG